MRGNMFQTFVLAVFLFHATAVAKKPAFPIKEDLKEPLLSLLDEAVNLHRAVYSKKEDQINIISLKMARKIRELENSPRLPPYHQGSYIHRLLQGLKPQLEAVKTPNGKRQRNIASINRSLTYMAHVYGLRKYAVFFCPQDRSVWMQDLGDAKKGKIKPLHLQHRSCGALVAK